MPGFNPSFRIQGQVYHHIGSVVPSMRESRPATGANKCVINETKRPTGEHARRYNSALCDEVGILMPNENQGHSSALQ